MSSTNSTPNYNLSQWVSSDYFLMSDFNADNLAIDTALAAKANLCNGTYTGTGTSGASAPVSLSFSFTPKMVVVSGAGGKDGEAHEVSVIFIKNHTGAGYTAAKAGAAASVELSCTWQGNSLAFYSASGGSHAALEQLNAQGEIYSYVAF